MRIAAFPKCWIEEICDGRMSLFDWIEQSVDLECEGLELYSGFLKSHETHYLKKIRSRTESLGMSLPMMCYSPDFTIPDEDARQKEVEKQIEIIRVTAQLGGEFCRILSGQRRPHVSREQGMEWVVKCIEACLPTAEACGVVLVIENHYKDGFWEYPEFAQKMEIFLQIVERIDSPYFGVQFDPSNALIAGEDPMILLDRVLSRVRTVHASDRYLRAGRSLEDLRQGDGMIGYSQALCHGVTGKGLNDYDAIFTRLISIHFDGWISIEDGMDGMKEMKASVDFLKHMRKKYGGVIA